MCVFMLLESRNSSFVTYLGPGMAMVLFHTYLLILYIAKNVIAVYDLNVDISRQVGRSES